MKYNLNNMAMVVTKKEGLKKSVSIAQVKEIMKIVFTMIASMNFEDVADTVRRYK